MNSRKCFKMAMMTLVLLIMLACFADAVQAAGAGLDEKRGIEGLLSSKGSGDDPRAPNKTQKFVGVASFGVMIVVVKYL